MDEDQEAIARIRLFVDSDDKQRESAQLAEDRTDGYEPPSAPVYTSDSYSLGSPLSKTTARTVEWENSGVVAFRSF